MMNPSKIPAKVLVEDGRKRRFSGNSDDPCTMDLRDRVERNFPEFIARVTSHIPDKGQVMVR